MWIFLCVCSMPSFLMVNKFGNETMLYTVSWRSTSNFLVAHLVKEINTHSQEEKLSWDFLLFFFLLVQSIFPAHGSYLTNCFQTKTWHFVELFKNQKDCLNLKQGTFVLVGDCLVKFFSSQRVNQGAGAES